MSAVWEFLRSLLGAPHVQRPADLTEFEEARERMHTSAKRLTRAVKEDDDDNLTAMIRRLKNKKGNGSKR